MILYFRDTRMSYAEISKVMNELYGPASKETWHNNSDGKYGPGIIEVYDQDPKKAMMLYLMWN